MKKISSRATVFHKRIFPIVWFGGIAVFVVMALRDLSRLPEERWVFFAVPAIMIVVGVVLMKKLLWDLADEVHDAGNYLLVRKGSEEERVALNNIINVSATNTTNPQRVTLRLAKPGKFGTEIAFVPRTPFTFNPFHKNAIVEDLILRVDRARRA